MFRSVYAALALALLGAVPAVAHEFKVGAIVLDHPWTRATPPGAPAAGGYVTIRNAGTAADRLVGGSTPVAARLELHDMAVKDGIMQMRQVDAVEIPAGGQVEFKPGGFHVMLIGLKQPLKQGDTVKAELQFEKAGKVEVEFQIEAIGATRSGHGG